MRHADAAIACAATVLGVALSGDVYAAEIHKCANRGAIAYQTSPCGDEQTEVAVLTTRDARAPAESGTSLAARDEPSRSVERVDTAGGPRGARWRPFARMAIAVGMTDDEVLNTPNGGVPTKISRLREGHVWRERWTYAARDGTLRELEFVNGTLASIVDGASQSPSLRLAALP
jgi:hypothetical protein